MQQRGGEESLVPQPRGSLPIWCAVALATVTTVAVCSHAQNDLPGLYTSAMLTLTLGPVLHGVCLLAEEVLYHRTTRYHGRRALWRQVSGCLNGRALVVGLAGLMALLTRGTPLPPQGDWWSLVVLACGFYPLLKTLRVLGPSEVELSEVCEGRKMNVAHGLAWSFYLGYLKLVLPNLEVSIPAFRALHMDGPFKTRGSRKLLLLLPLNANVASKLEDVDTNIRFYKNLPDQWIDRAGVKGRVYKQSVYRVLDDKGQAQHCLIEYAAPLLTLHSMSQDSSAGFGEGDRREQVLLFYRTLRDILDRSLECRNLYRLVLLNDDHEEDPHFLSKTILQHLQQQDTEEFCLVPHQEEGVPAPESSPPSEGGQDQVEPMSREPTLMFSFDLPQPLREPIENTYHFHDPKVFPRYGK
ncbi:stimulator of interferon genes protein [Aplochiton taeniatus]